MSGKMQSARKFLLYYESVDRCMQAGMWKTVCAAVHEIATVHHLMQELAGVYNKNGLCDFSLESKRIPVVK